MMNRFSQRPWLTVALAALGTLTLPVFPAAFGQLTARPGTPDLTLIGYDPIAQVAAVAVTGFTPAFGAAGTIVTVTGSGFTGTTNVNFNGRTAGSVTVVSDTELTVRVPNGATSGPITVTSPSGTGTSAGRFGYDLMITRDFDIPGGAYHQITIAAMTAGNLLGDVTVEAGLLVLPNGQFDDGGFRVLGPGAFRLMTNALMVIRDPQGISLSGPTGSIQTTGPRTYSRYGRYLYNATVPQLTGNGLPSRVRDLLVFNFQNVSLTQALTVRRLVSIANTGNLVLNGFGLTLLSDADTTAQVNNFNAGRVIGTATLQRYLTPDAAPGLGYRHLSSPVAATTIADLAAPGFTPRVNPAYNALPAPTLPPAQFPNVFAFDETRGAPTDDFLTGYYSPAAVTDPLERGRGYTAYMPPRTLDFVGTLNTGGVFVNGLTRTGSSSKSGWHLLGNPYPAPIDWDVVHVPADMSSAISVWKPVGTGNNGVYLTRVSNGDGTGVGNLPDGLVPMAQGFFAEVTGAGPVNFIFTNAMRVITFTNPAHYRPTGPTADAPPQIRLTLRAATATLAAEQDETLLYFPAGATAAPADRFDGARPMHNVGIPTLLSLGAAGTELAVNGLPTTVLTGGGTVPLLLDLPTAGTYTLTAEELTNMSGTPVGLFDALTGTTYDLTTRPTVTFTALRAGETRGRFVVVFGNRVLGTAAEAGAAGQLAVFPNPARPDHDAQVRLAPQHAGPVRLLDATGRVVRLVMPAAAADYVTLPLTGLAPGVYTVQAGPQAARLVVE